MKTYPSRLTQLSQKSGKLEKRSKTHGTNFSSPSNIIFHGNSRNKSKQYTKNKNVDDRMHDHAKALATKLPRHWS